MWRILSVSWGGWFRAALSHKIHTHSDVQDEYWIFCISKNHTLIWMKLGGNFAQGVIVSWDKFHLVFTPILRDMIKGIKKMNFFSIFSKYLIGSRLCVLICHIKWLSLVRAFWKIEFHGDRFSLRFFLGLAMHWYLSTHIFRTKNVRALDSSPSWFLLKIW